MGRHAKPALLHLVEGNKSKMRKDELQRKVEAEKSLKLAKDKIRPPAWMDSEGKKVFRRLVKEFAEIDILTNVDIYALSMFCDAYSDYVRYTKIIAEDGDMVEHTNKAGETNRVPHPLITKKSQAFHQMDKMMGKIGLSPVDRAKLINAMLLEKENEDTPFGDRL